MAKPRHVSRRRTSRRQFLRGSAGIGAGVAFFGAAAASLGVGAAMFGKRKLAEQPQVVVLPNGAQLPQSTPPANDPVVVSRQRWGALPVDHSARNEYGHYWKGSNPEGWYVYSDDLRRSYQTLIIHHSAFYKAGGLDTLLEIQRLHRDERGWADIGYHFLIDQRGTTYAGRDLSVRGAHTAGYNTGSAGICLMGDFRTRGPTAAQMAAARALIRWLVERLAPTHLAGHQQFNAGTECPGRQLIANLKDLADRAGLQYGIEGFVPVARAEACGCGCCACAATL